MTQAKREQQTSLLMVVVLTLLFTYGTSKTWFMLQSDFPVIPIILGFIAVMGGFKTISLLISTFYNFLLRREAWRVSARKGSANWATKDDLKQAGMYQTNGVFLGCDMDGHPIFYEGETHGLTLSPAGGGKTVSIAVPNLCHLALPMVVTDFKGTLACMTKTLRIKHHKQQVFCVNPAHLYADKLGTPARYNPMQILLDDWNQGSHKDLIADAQDMALQLYPDPPRQGDNLFWRQGSRKIIVFVLVYLVTQKDGTEATLSVVLTLLRNVQQLKEACYVASCSDVLNGELADMAVDLLAKLEAQDTRQVESFLEGAVQSLLAFSPSGWLAESTSTCDFRFKDLKSNTPATVYLIADPTKIKVFAPWLGLLGWAALTELTRCQNTKPVFFLLDEATNFRIHNISNALTGLREFGIRVWFVIQELEEWVKNEGRESLETLLSQTEAKQFFGVNSYKTADLVSKMLGEYTIKSPNYNLGHDVDDPVQHSVNEHARRLLTPDEVRRFPDMILFIRNLFPVHAQKVGYHEVKPWTAWVDENPLFGTKLKGKIRVWLRY